MRKKIFDALKTKYASLGLSDETIDKVATGLESRVNDEKDIETAIAGVEPALKVLQSSYDTFRNEKSGLMKQIDDYKKMIPDPTKKEDEEKKEDDAGQKAEEALTLDGVKSIFAEMLKPINDRFLEQDRISKATERQRLIVAKAAEYKIPESVAKMMAVPDDADLDVFMREAKQTFADNGFSEVKPPQTAEQIQKTESESIASMISDGTKAIVESKKK